MNLTELREAKAELAREILTLLRDFQSSHGVAVLDCRVHTADVRTIEAVAPKLVTVGVSLELESL